MIPELSFNFTSNPFGAIESNFGNLANTQIAHTQNEAIEAGLIISGANDPFHQTLTDSYKVGFLTSLFQLFISSHSREAQDLLKLLSEADKGAQRVN